MVGETGSGKLLLGVEPGFCHLAFQHFILLLSQLALDLVLLPSTKLLLAVPGKPDTGVADGGGRLRPGTTTRCSWVLGLSAGVLAQTWH